MSDPTAPDEREYLAHGGRVRLEALRYAVNEEASSYLAIMRTFTGEVSGLLSDQSAAEVAQRLAGQGFALDVDTVDARLSYLVEHGNLARSPRETEARSLREYLQNRARYQLTQRGELVQRHVEELLGHTEAAREVSTEMLGGILDGLVGLGRLDDAAIARADPDALARDIATLFAQFERLVSSTRDFYTYLAQVLVRYDLDRAEFQAFKTALLDYLQRFVDEVARHMPQLAQALQHVRTTGAGAVCAGERRAAAARRRGGGRAARAGAGPGGLGRAARVVRRRAGAGLRRRRRAAAGDGGDAGAAGQPASHRRRWSSGTEPLRRPAEARPVVRGSGRRHRARPVGFGVRPLLVPPPRIRRRRRRRPGPTDRVLVADALGGGAGGAARAGRAGGPRPSGRSGRTTRRPRPPGSPNARRPSGAEGPRSRRSAGTRGGSLRFASRTRRGRALLDLYARALVGRGRPLGPHDAAEARVDEVRLVVTRTPGVSTTVTGPAGRLELVDLTLTVHIEAGERRATG